MSYSYKCYSDTKDFMKKFVNAEEGAIIYGISKSRIIVIAREAGAVYKVGNSALINTELFEKYLERFREPARELPKHTWDKLKEIHLRLPILQSLRIRTRESFSYQCLDTAPMSVMKAMA